MRLLLAIWIGKTIGWLTQVFGIGSGSSAPGMVALRVYPDLVRDLSIQIGKERILVSATNGKTTTCELIEGIFKKAGFKYLRNNEGANLDRGFASVLIKKSNLFGKMNTDYGLFEADEAVLSWAIENIKPTTIALGNLFRDQLDRYGEIETLANKWRESLKKYKGHLILNADDPVVASLGESKKNVFYYGISDSGDQGIENNLQQGYVGDSMKCVKCGNDLFYYYKTTSHMGAYKCKKCNFSRPNMNIEARSLKSDIDGTSFIFGSKKARLNIPGRFNVYNALAAYITGRRLKVSVDDIINTFKLIKPAFGRMEEFNYKGRVFRINLIKNPAGTNAVLESIKGVKNAYSLLLLNDKIADGQDVSWIWDANFEYMNKFRKIVCLGTRKYDMALRLKYAENKNFQIGEDFWNEIKKSIRNSKKCERIFIFTTYTAMLQLRKILENKRLVDKI